ncbi:MAG: hypothetical protein ACFFBD_12835, partial [Candidatus Hodarchaeota archaeon]
LFVGFFLLFILPSLAVSGQGHNIVIDGNLADWNGIYPVVIDDEINATRSLDLQKGFLAVNDSHLFVRVDFAAPFENWASLLANLTVQTSNSVYILMCQVIYETTPHWSFTSVHRGVSLNSSLNAPDASHLATHPGWGEVDLSTKRTMEFAFLLTDIEIDKTAELNVTFWHIGNVSAGTIYNVPLLDAGSTPPPSSTSENQLEIGSTPPSDFTLLLFAIFGAEIVIIAFLIVFIKKKLNL